MKKLILTIIACVFVSQAQAAWFQNPFGGLGADPNVVPVCKSGINTDLDAGTESVWNVGGTFLFPATTQQMEIVSSSASDSETGPGIQKVLIQYLDHNYDSYTVTMTVTGVTESSTTATNIYRINRFEAYDTEKSTSVAIGTISIRALGNTPVYSQIAVGQTRARNAAYSVPNGYSLYITNISGSAIRNTSGADVVFTFESTYNTKSNVQRDFFTPMFEFAAEDGTAVFQFDIPIRIPETADIQVEALSTSSNITVITNMRGYLKRE